MGDSQNLQQKLDKILKGYNSTLQNCVQKISENNQVNQKMAEEIQKKINIIKERVNLARENVEEIGKQQTLFSNTMKQEKETIQKEQEGRMNKSRQDKERLQNQLKEAQNASAAAIQELKTKKDNEIQQMKEKAASEATEAMRIQKEEDEAKLGMKLDEINQKMEEAKRVAAENASRIQKEAEEAKKMADNERSAQEQKLLELEQQRQAIFEKDTACEEQLEKLKANVTDMKGVIEKMNGDIETQNTRNSEDKQAAAKTLETKLAELALAHKGEMEAQLKTALDEKKQYVEEAAASQVIAIQKAVEDVNEANLVHQKHIEEATKATRGNLQAQLDECKKTTEEYTKEVDNHLKKYKELERQFDESSNYALDGLRELVEKLGIEDIARLEKTIRDILGENDPGGTGTDEPGSPLGLRRQNSGQVAATTVDMADREIRRSQSLLGNELTGQEAVDQLDKEDKEADIIKKKREEKHRKRKERMEAARKEQEEFEKTTLKREPGRVAAIKGQDRIGVPQAWVENKIDKNKYTDSHKDNLATKKLLLEDVDTFISRIDSPEKMTQLINNVIQNHGIHNGKKKKYNTQLERFKDGKRYKNIQEIYKKALVGIIEGGLEQEIYVEILDKIEETTVEEVFEELLAAFHLVYSTDKISNVYSMGASGGRGYKDNDYTRNGKVAAYIWKPRPRAEFFEGGRLKKNGKMNDDVKMSNMVTIKMHDYIHSHDKVGKALGKKKSEVTAFAGGFRHGKGSQKKNKRTLKSKITAKKYSLKVGKKKRGKKGNKSQKRRKSIKIRI